MTNCRKQTGSAWNAIGEAVFGSLAGTQLAHLESAVGEWYELAGRHPDTNIFEAS
jgi:hypothetical protein